MKWVEHNNIAVNLELCKDVAVSNNSIYLGYNKFEYNSNGEAVKAFDNILKFIRDNVRGVLHT